MRAKDIKWGKVSPVKGVGKLHNPCRETKSDHLLIALTNINSKRIEDLNTGLLNYAIKLLEKNKGSSRTMAFRTGHQRYKQKKKSTSGTTSNLSVCIAKEIIKKNEKTTYGVGENICKPCYQIRG